MYLPDAAARAPTDRTARIARLLRATLWLGVVLTASASVIELYCAATFPIEETSGFLFDDAYYYLGVARNLAAGNGSMFREPMQTNGYQPLWLGVLASSAWLFELSKTGLFPWTVGLIDGLKVSTLVYFARRPRVEYACCGLALRSGAWHVRRASSPVGTS